MSDQRPNGSWPDQWKQQNQWTGPGNVPPRNAGVPTHLRQDGPDTGWGQAGGQSSPQSSVEQSGPLGSPSAPVIVPNTPGWLARYLLWAGIVISFLPAVLLAPILMSGDFEEVRRLHTLVSLFAGILGLLLVAAAFAVVRNTSWARRLIGGGLYVFANILTLTVPAALGAFVAEISYRLDVGLWVTTVVFAVFSSITLALRLVGWSIARNRRWWVLLVAAGCGVLIPVINALLQTATSTTLDQPGLPYWVGGVFVPIISLLLVFGALGLLHVLGGLRDGAAPVVAQPTLGESRKIRRAQGAQAGPGLGNPPTYGPVGQAVDQQTFGAQPPNSQPGYAQAQYGSSQPVASQPGYAPPQHGNSQSPARSSEQFRPPQNSGQQGPHSTQAGPSDFQPPRRPRH